MRKLRSMMVLLAAGTFAASGLFAQEIKFDGYVNSGLGVVYSSEKDAADPFVAAAGVDSTSNAFRIRLNAAYANEAGNAGANLRLQAAGGYNNVTLPVAYGWFSAFDKILTVKGGIVDDGTWSTGGFFLNSDVGEGLGALARISVSGLDIGLGAYLAETPGETDSNQEYGDHHPRSGNYYIRDFDEAKYTVSLGYTLPDVVKLVASYRTKSEAGTGVKAGAGVKVEDDDAGGFTTTRDFTGDTISSRMRAGVSLLAVPHLKANVELELDNLQDFKAMKTGDKNAWGGTVSSATSSSGKINITETFQYDLGSLSVGLWAVEWLSQAESADLAFYANPWVSYAFGSIVPRLDIGYGSGAQADFNNKNLNWHRTNYSATYKSDNSIISIRPSVKFNIDSKTLVEIGDLIDIDGVPKNTWANDPDADSRISNVFYVDLKWSF